MVDEEVGGVGEVVEQLGLKQHDRGSNKRIIGRRWIVGVCFVMGRIIDVDFELVCSGGGRGMRVLVVGGVVWGGGMNFVREGILERVLVRKWGRVGDIGGVEGVKEKAPTHPHRAVRVDGGICGGYGGRGVIVVVVVAVDVSSPERVN